MQSLDMQMFARMFVHSVIRKHHVYFYINFIIKKIAHWESYLLPSAVKTDALPLFTEVHLKLSGVYF